MLLVGAPRPRDGSEDCLNDTGRTASNHEGNTLLFSEWETFYVIVGTAAGALAGLMFVVIALIADVRGSATQIDAFGTPTVVHFGAVLLLSAILAAPWPTALGAAVTLGSLGAAGVVYMVIVLRRARRQNDYQPVFEDWLFHTALPLVSYAVILAASIGLRWSRMTPLFAIAAAALLLIAVGLHNAWDTVTYVVLVSWERRKKEQEKDKERQKETT
jgi:hypothetical protein